MPLHVATDILLPAPPSTVWAVLTDFAAYPAWNPFLTCASGDWAAGNTVAVTAGGMDFTPEVLVFQPAQELRWRGKLWFDALFTGEHYFVLSDRGDGTTHLAHGEYFRGMLLPVLRRKLARDTEAGFAAMNAALARRLAKHSDDRPAMTALK